MSHPLLLALFKKLPAMHCDLSFGCCWCIQKLFLCINKFQAGSDGLKSCQLWITIYFLDELLFLPRGGSCVTIDLKLITMVNKATSYGFWLRSSKHNSCANMNFVLVPTHLYTHTIKSCQLWSLKLVAMVMTSIFPQHTTRWRLVRNNDQLLSFNINSTDLTQTVAGEAPWPLG